MFALLGLLAVGACGPTPASLIPDLPIETGVGFVNLSKQFYVAFRVRSHDAAGNAAPHFASSLLAPGAAQRVRMLDVVGTGCAPSFDVQVLLYRRVNSQVPIGLDVGEAVEPAPMAAGQILDLPACNVAELETYTIVNFDAPDGTARVKFAQDTLVDSAIRDAGLFPNPDVAWEVSGVDPVLAQEAPPPLAPMVPMSGRVADLAGNGFEGVGVLVRARFRVRVQDGNAANDPDAGFGDPIAVAVTDATGRFELLRPAGGYQLEFFADGLAFRPVTIEIESPSQEVSVIAELFP